jgi:hypothetical protein
MQTTRLCHPFGDGEGVSLLSSAGMSLWTKRFGMNPPQRMDADAEQAAALDGGSRPTAKPAPGNLDRIGGHLQPGSRQLWRDAGFKKRQLHG